MNPDSEVTVNLTDKETEAQYFNSLKYANSLGDGSKKINPEVLKEMRGDTGDITDFISRPDYTIKTIHKEYAESEDGTRKIKLAKETVDKLNKEDLNREYYVRVDGVKKEVLIESVPKAEPYTYHLNKSLSQPFEKGLFEYSYDSFQYFIDGKYRESIGEISSAIGGITDPLTLGAGRKLGDEAGRVEAGSIQYGSKEDITEKVEILRDSGRFTGDFIVSSITTPLLMKGISKGKEIIGKYRIKSKYSDIYEYKYNSYTNPGPLSNLQDQPNSNFYGGRYNEEILKEAKFYYRIGDETRALGQYFTEIPSTSVAKARIDSAIKLQWIGKNGELTGKSVLNTLYKIEIPKGTTIYKGPVGYQGGVYLGGLQHEQIFIYKPWEIEGIKIIERRSLR